MSSGLPDQVDVWRMVSGRRCFSGSIRVSELTRLRGSLAGEEGSIACDLEFDTDELDQAYVQVQVQGELPLVCQRTLEVYRQPVSISLRLGLIRREEQEAALAPGYEAFLVPADGMVAPVDLVEDELILALPLVPTRPDSVVAVLDNEDAKPQRPNPFAVLEKMRLQ